MLKSIWILDLHLELNADAGVCVLLAQLAIQSSEYVRRVRLVVCVLQQSLALIWRCTQRYFHTRRLRNGIGVHGFIHGIGEIALQEET